MTEEEIQAAVDALAALLTEKGLRSPHVSAQINADSQVLVYWRWTKGPGYSDWDSHFDYGDRAEDALAAARRKIETLPSAAQLKVDNARRLIAAALEAARDADIDAQAGTAYVVQLEAMVKALSENALTDQRS